MSISTDSKPTASRSSGTVVVVVSVALLCLLPTVYVLSIGPVVWLDARGYVDTSEQSPLFAFYWPLIWLSLQSDTTQAILTWYMELWLP